MLTQLCGPISIPVATASLVFFSCRPVRRPSPIWASYAAWGYLVPAVQHQPDLFASDKDRRQKLSTLIDRTKDRYGRNAIGFGLFPPPCGGSGITQPFRRVSERPEF